MRQSQARCVAGRRGVWRDDPETLKASLLKAVEEHPQPSLAQVAYGLNYETCAPLQRLDTTHPNRLRTA